MRGIIALVFCLWSALLQAADCATCHPAEANAHLKTAHAAALVAPEGSAFASNLPDHPLGEAANGYLFTYKKQPDGLVAIAERGADRAEGKIEWVFGSGRQGQTPLIVQNGKHLEHRVSFYAEKTKYGITTGQANGASANAEKALGLAQSDQDLKACFGCHASGIASDLSHFTPGVQCDRCHAGAQEHANGGAKPVNPGKLDAAAQVQLCGTCHRVKPPSGSDSDIANVRFQPLRLMKSQCFIKGNVECTTCHPAHMDAVRDKPFVYNAKCLGCHANQEQHIAAQQDSNCIGCHMPRARPHPLLAFTDHYIRVVKK